MTEKKQRTKSREDLSLGESKEGIASPDGAISFLLFIFAIIDGYTLIFRPKIQAVFSIGSIQTILSIGAFVAGLINLLRGKDRGNVNVLATLLLGLFPGLIKLFSILAYSEHIDYDVRLFGVIYFIGATFIAGLSYKRRFKAAYRFIGTVALSAGLFFNGAGLLFDMDFLLQIAGGLYFIFAFEMYYFGLTIMHFYYDHILPQGHSLFYRRKKRRR